MIEHMKHYKFNTGIPYNVEYREWVERVNSKINEIIRIVSNESARLDAFHNRLNALEAKNRTPVQKKKLEKISLLEKQLKQLKLEL